PEIKLVGRTIAPEIQLCPVVVRVATAGQQGQVCFRQLAGARIGKRHLHLADEAGFVVPKLPPDIFKEFVAQRRALRLREARRSVCRGRRSFNLLPAPFLRFGNPRPCRGGQFAVGRRALFQFQHPPKLSWLIVPSSDTHVTACCTTRCSPVQCSTPCEAHRCSVALERHISSSSDWLR